MAIELTPGARRALIAAAGEGGWSEDADMIVPRLTDWRGRSRGGAAMLVRPRDAATVAKIVAAAAEHGIAIVPQGGRTGLVGGGLPEPDRTSILLSTDRMSAIRSIDAAGQTMIAEAGVVLTAVHEAASGAGLRFPLSLAAKGSATVGGLVSTNAGGTQVLRHGTMRARVAGLEAVLADGTILDQLAPLPKDNTGYDLTQLLIGAEGTLGVVTAATLILAPEPAARAVGWAAVESPEAALAMLGRLRDAAESFELIHENALALVLKQFPGERRPVGPSDWHVLVELGGPDGVGERLMAAFAEAGGDAVVAMSGAQADALWRLRELVPEAERKDGRSVKHDIALPVALVPEYVRRVTPEIVAAFPGARPFVFGHLGDGNLHYNFRPPEDVDADRWMAAHGDAVTAFVHDRVAERHGSISAEHGIGVWKRAEMLRLADPAKLTALRAIKTALDPSGIMNPGKIF